MLSKLVSFIADATIPGLARAEVSRLAANDDVGAARELRRLDRRTLRDLGLDRSAA